MRKKLLFTSLCFAFLCTDIAVAQVPQLMSYQSIVRNNAGALVANQTVGLRISILKSTATGNAVYVETQLPLTNTNGLISLQIGAGNIVSGSFSAIDWASGPYFLKTEVDPAGAANYSISGTTQLLSVPYALYAAKSGDAGIGITNARVISDSLRITLSSGNIINAGNVRGATGAAGQNAFGGPANDGGVIKTFSAAPVAAASVYTVPTGKTWKVNYSSSPIYGTSEYSSGNNDNAYLTEGETVSISNNQFISITEYPNSFLNVKNFRITGTGKGGFEVTYTVPAGKTWKINNYRVTGDNTVMSFGKPGNLFNFIRAGSSFVYNYIDKNLFLDENDIIYIKATGLSAASFISVIEQSK